MVCVGRVGKHHGSRNTEYGHGIQEETVYVSGDCPEI